MNPSQVQFGGTRLSGNAPFNEIVLEAEVHNLPKLLAFTETALAGSRCPAGSLKQIKIAVEEIFVNIARYAYGSEIGSVSVKIGIGDEAIIEFEDSGIPYDPLAREDPDVTQPAQDRGIGGLGIFIVKRIMDSIEYRHKDGSNILTIRKTIA